MTASRQVAMFQHGVTHDESAKDPNLADSAHLSAKSKLQKQREFVSCVTRHALTSTKLLADDSTWWAQKCSDSENDTGTHKLKRDKRPSSSD